MLNLAHKKLEVWKFSVNFVKKIYRLSESFPKTEIYGIVNQLRRAVISRPSNIAEGASRQSASERKRFYQIARSSLVELDTQLELSVLLNYDCENDLNEISADMNYIFAMLTKMIQNT
jgi:four helix bundle protein